MVLYCRRATIPASLLKSGLGVQLCVCLPDEHLHRNLMSWFARKFYWRGAEIFSNLISLLLCPKEDMEVCQVLLFQLQFLYILILIKVLIWQFRQTPT